MNFSLEKFGIEILMNNNPKKNTIYSIGYEGKSSEEFFIILKNNNIRHLIDIRETPYSNKPSFSKKELMKLSKKCDIEYYVIRELGSPKYLRRKIMKNKDMKNYFKEYKKYLLIQKRLVELLVNIALQKNSAIMCFEKNWRFCHRCIIEEELKKYGFIIKHL